MKSSAGALFAFPQRHQLRLWVLLCSWGMLIFSAFAEPPAGSELSTESLPKDGLFRLGNPRFQHGSEILDVAVADSGDLAVSVGRDHWVQVWKLSTGECLVRFHRPWVSAVALAPDGKILVTGDDFGRLSEWGIHEKKCTHLRTNDKEHKTRIVALGYSPTGEHFVSAGCKGKVCAWKNQKEGLRWLAEIKAVKPVQGAVTISPDGKTVAWSDTSGVITLWQTSQKQTQGNWQAHPGTISRLRFSDENDTLTSLGCEGKLCQWKVPSQKPILQQQVMPAGKRVACFTPDRSVIVTTRAAHRLGCWSVRERCWSKPESSKLGVAQSCAFSSDGTTLALANRRGEIQVRDLLTGKLRCRITPKPQQRFVVALSPKAKKLAWTSRHAPVTVCDAQTGKPQVTFPNPPGSVPVSLEFCSGGETVAVSYEKINSHRHRVQLWNVQTGREQTSFSPPVLIQRLRYARGSGVLHGAGNNGALYAWTLRTGQRHQRKVARHDNRGVMAVSQDGRWVATGNREGLVTVTDTATGTCQHWTGHIGRVSALAFSRDGRGLLSGGERDSTVLLWETFTGQVVRRFDGHLGSVSGVGFSADSRRAYSVGQDATLLVWDVTGLSSGRVDRIAKSKDQQEKCWRHLTTENAEKAYDAIWALADAPKVSVPMIRESFKPWMSNDAKRIEKFIRDLDAFSYDVRENASGELAKILDIAEPALRRAVAKPPSLEVKMRALHLLAKMRSPGDVKRDVRRLRRAVVVLEKIGHEEAQEMLEEVSQQSLLPELQQDAKQALQRLRK